MGRFSMQLPLMSSTCSSVRLPISGGSRSIRFSRTDRMLSFEHWPICAHTREPRLRFASALLAASAPRPRPPPRGPSILYVFTEFTKEKILQSGEDSANGRRFCNREKILQTGEDSAIGRRFCKRPARSDYAIENAIQQKL